ncbi:alpha-1,3-rhamnosyltransferase WapR [Fibrobacterales bacterium]|nr:alpha-1,3-rhamnosyltransferase WapR [Fibrobacterales bacterium]
MTPLVSVLMPSYCHKKYVEIAVRSVMEQKGVSFELLVIDDGSNDGTPKILQKLSAELGFYFLSRENRGVIKTLNELAKISKGKYICTMASDDIMPPDRLKIQAEFMEKHPEYAASFGQIKEMSEAGEVEKNINGKFLKGIPEVSFDDLYSFKKLVHGCTEMVQKNAFDFAGGYSDEFIFEDFPLFWALAKRFGNLAVLSNVFCYYRTHKTNLRKNYFPLFFDALKLTEKYKENKFYKKAKNNCKNFCYSSIIEVSKITALKNIPLFFNFSFGFFKNSLKLFMPKSIYPRLARIRNGG